MKTILCPLLTTLLLAPLATLHAADARPNIVFIISDDQGAGDYGFMGHPQVQTPHLDKLAAQSLAFPRGFVTTSVCCPSLATIITGLYPHQHKVTANDPPLPPGTKAKGGRGSTAELTAQWNAMLDQVSTLPRLLASAGYLSFQTGKWWQGDFTRGGFTHGMSQGSRHGDAGLTIGREGMQPIYDFIAESRKQQKPFFVWYAPFMPHTPHTPPERLFKKYATMTDSPHLARYWAMCEWFDETCGALMDYVDNKGLAENTIFVYVTDNGWIQDPEAPKCAPRSKQSQYDGGVRTPIIVRWKGRVAPKMEDQRLASSLDIAPTVLKACGVPVPSVMSGLDLLNDQELEKRNVVHGECFTHNAVDLDAPEKSLRWRWVVEGDWKLILPDPKNQPEDKVELYNLRADPQEGRNLASEDPSRVKQLQGLIDARWNPAR